MRSQRLLYLCVLCCGLTLGAVAQKKPARGPSENSAQQNEVAARRVFEDLLAQGRYGEINQVFDPNCKVHFGNRNMGLSQAVAEGKGWRGAAPDLVMRTEQVRSNGNTVTISWSAQGTHTRQGIGVKATGKHFSMRDRSEFIFKNGKIVEVRNNEYRTELFRQLGVSRTTASLFDTTDRLWAAISQILPDPLYASLR